MRTQLLGSAGFGVVVFGISHEAIRIQLENRGIEGWERQDIFDKVVLIEGLFVPWLNRQSSKKRGVKGG